MENKINIAEILRDVPKGTRLYSPLFGEVKFNGVTGEKVSVLSTYEEGREVFNYFSENGIYYSEYSQSECLLFPSSEMRDWTKFFKRGDVVYIRAANNVTDYAIFESWENNDYTRFNASIFYSNKDGFAEKEVCTTKLYTKANDILKAKLITFTERYYEGKYNPDTLQVEPVEPEFKDGDIVVYGKSVAICRKIYEHTLYFYASIDETFGLIFDGNTVSPNAYRLATDSEKQQLFDALAKIGKRWDAEKKQLVDLPKQHKFKPYDKVLVRVEDEDEWGINLFSHYNRVECFKYQCINGCYRKCIPYEGNEHLLGTTDNPK